MWPHRGAVRAWNLGDLSGLTAGSISFPTCKMALKTGLEDNTCRGLTYHVACSVYLANGCSIIVWHHIREK